MVAFVEGEFLIAGDDSPDMVVEFDLFGGLEGELVVVVLPDVEDGFVLLVLGLLVHVNNSGFGTVGELGRKLQYLQVFFLLLRLKVEQLLGLRLPRQYFYFKNFLLFILSPHL